MSKKKRWMAVLLAAALTINMTGSVSAQEIWGQLETAMPEEAYQDEIEAQSSDTEVTVWAENTLETGTGELEETSEGDAVQPEENPEQDSDILVVDEAQKEADSEDSGAEEETQQEEQALGEETEAVEEYSEDTVWRNVIYVGEDLSGNSGSDTEAGTAAAPVLTLAKAYEKAADQYTGIRKIYEELSQRTDRSEEEDKLLKNYENSLAEGMAIICTGEVTAGQIEAEDLITKLQESEIPVVTIKGQEEGNGILLTDTSSTCIFPMNTKLTNLTLTNSCINAEPTVYANGHSVEIAESVTTEGRKKFTIYGGGNVTAIKDTDLVVYGGNWGAIYGGGSNTVTENTVLKLGASVQADYVYGGGQNALVAGNTNVLVQDGTYHTIFGGNDVCGAIGGSASVTVAGGTVDTVYGGGCGQATTAHQTEVILQNGKIAGNIYGGSKFGSVESAFVTARESTDTDKVQVLGNVFGGGYGVSSSVTNAAVQVELKLAVVTGDGEDGDVQVTEKLKNAEDKRGESTASAKWRSGYTSGSYISGNVFGGSDMGKVGDGYINTSTNTAVTQQCGITDVTISSGYIHGNVFGGGNGQPGGMDESGKPITEYTVYMGTVFGTSHVTLTGGYVNGNVFGCGQQSRIYAAEDTDEDGSADASVVRISTAETDRPILIGGSIFGGGNKGNGSTQNASAATVYGDTHVILKGKDQMYTQIYLLSNGTSGGGVYGDGNLCVVSGRKYVTLENFSCGIGKEVSMLKTFYSLQRVDVADLIDSRIVLKGAFDLVAENADDTMYSINRVSQLNLKENSTIKVTKTVNLLGGLASDEQPDRQFINRGNNNGNAPISGNNYTAHGGVAPTEPLTQDEVKAYISAYNAYAENGTKDSTYHSVNVVCVANGGDLEIKKSTSEYGPVTGLFTLQLVNASPGEDGGFVYADIMGKQLAEDQYITGNFICVTRRSDADNSEYMYAYHNVGGRLTGEQYEYYVWYLKENKYHYDGDLSAICQMPTQEAYMGSGRMFAGVSSSSTVNITKDSSFTAQFVTKYIPSVFNVGSQRQMTETLVTVYEDTYLLDPNGVGYTVKDQTDGSVELLNLTNTSDPDVSEYRVSKDENGRYTVNYLDGSGNVMEDSDGTAMTYSCTAETRSSSFRLPKGTMITLLASLDENNPTYWYYYCTEPASEVELSEFQKMNTANDGIASRSEESVYDMIFTNSASRVTENIIFVFDFSEVAEEDWIKDSAQSGTVMLRHTWQNGGCSADIMDYVASESQTNEETVSYTYSREMPKQTDTFGVSQNSDGITQFAVTNADSSVVYGQKDAMTFRLHITPDTSVTNTQYDEREYAVILTLKKRSEENEIPFPEGTVFTCQGQKLIAGKDNAYVIVPAETVGTHEVEIRSELYGFDPADYELVAKLYSTTKEGYYNSIPVDANASDKSQAAFTIASDPVYALKVQEQSAKKKIREKNHFVSAGDVLDFLITTKADKSDTGVVNIRLYQYSNGAYVKKAVNSVLDGATAIAAEVNSLNTEWKPQVKAQAEAGVYRLEFTYHDRIEYWDFKVEQKMA